MSDANRRRDSPEVGATRLSRDARPRPATLAAHGKTLDGQQEARLIATRLGSSPKGYANWSLRLLARKVVELEIVDTVSRETVRRTLKKRHDESQNRVLGQETEHRRRKPTPDPEGAPVANREEVLETYEKPYDPACPVICIDEQPVQLLTPVSGCGEVASFHRVGNAPRVEWQVSAGPRSTRDALPTR